MASSINIGGTYKQISKVFCNINGTWKQVTKAHCNVNGTWREWHSGSENKLYRYGNQVTVNGVRRTEYKQVDVNTLIDLSTYMGDYSSKIGANSSKIFRVKSNPNSSTGALGIIEEIDPETHAVLRTCGYGDGIRNTKISYYANNIDATDNNIVICGFRSTSTYITVMWRINPVTMAYMGQYFCNLSAGVNTNEESAFLSLRGNTMYMYSHTSANDLPLSVIDINSPLTSNTYMMSYWGDVSYPSGSRGWATLPSATATSNYSYISGKERLMSSEGSYECQYLTKLNGTTIISQRNLGNVWTPNRDDTNNLLFAFKEG